MGYMNILIGMKRQPVRNLEELEAVVEAEARTEGPAALAALHAERARFRFAREIAALRKGRKMTQLQLSLRSGVHQSEISKVESGSINASQATYARLFYALEHDLKPVRVKHASFSTRSSSASRRPRKH